MHLLFSIALAILLIANSSVVVDALQSLQVMTYNDGAATCTTVTNTITYAPDTCFAIWDQPTWTATCTGSPTNVYGKFADCNSAGTTQINLFTDSNCATAVTCPTNNFHTVNTAVVTCETYGTVTATQAQCVATTTTTTTTTAALTTTSTTTTTAAPTTTTTTTTEAPTTTAGPTTTTTTAGPTTTSGPATTTAASTTPSPAPTTTTSPAPATTTTTASSPAATTTTTTEGLAISYVWDGTTSGTINFTIATDLVSNGYVALAQSDALMAGAGVACKLPSAAGTGTLCVGISTQNYGVVARSDSSISVLSASVSGARATVAVSIAPSSLNIATSGTITKRVIYSKGQWNAVQNLPSQHASASDRGARSVTFSAAGGSLFATSSGAGALLSGVVVIVAAFIVLLF